MKKTILLILSLLIILPVALAIPDGGISYWNAVEGSGSEAVDNWNGFNCTFKGDTTFSNNYPTYNISGSASKSYKFDGTGDYMNCSTSSELNPPSEMSILMWVNQTDMTSATNRGYFGRDLGGTTRSYYFGDGVGGNFISFVIYEDDGSEIPLYNSDSGLSNNVWYHIVAVANGTHIKTYVNGVLAPTTGGSGNPVSYDGTLEPETIQTVIGALRSDGSFPMNGELTEIKFFNRSVTLEEIHNDYNYGDVEGLPSVPPVINTSTYNMSSATSNKTAHRTNTSFPIPTTDSTPTYLFDIDLAGNCSIGLNDFNYTKMISNDSNTECSTTATTSMTCTLPASQALSTGTQNIYLACISNAGNENATSSSGALKVNLTTAADTCTYSGSGDWDVTLSDNCTVTTDVDLGTNTLTLTGDNGYFQINSGANLTTKKLDYKPDDFDGDTWIRLLSGGNLIIK